jgi:hypothetical protein
MNAHCSPLRAKFQNTTKTRGHEAIDDQIKSESGLAGLVRQRVHEFSDPEAEDEPDSGAAHGKHRVDEREHGNGKKPARAALHDALGPQFLFDQIDQRLLHAAEPNARN